MADPNTFSLLLEPEGSLGASSSRYLKDKPPLWQDVDPDENAAQCDKAIRGTLRKWVHPNDGSMYFSVRLAGSEKWCSKDLGWIIGALQKEHQRADDQRRLADYTCEGAEAKLTVKVDFILPQGERKTVTAATLSVENTPHSPPEATIRYKGAHKNLKATPPDVNPEIKKAICMIWPRDGNDRLLLTSEILWPKPMKRNLVQATIDICQVMLNEKNKGMLVKRAEIHDFATRFIQKSTSKHDLNKAHQAILDSALVPYNTKFRDPYDREEEPEYWQRVRKAVEKLMKKGKVPTEASQVEEDDVIDLSLPGLDEDEGEDLDITPEPADNVLQTPHQQRPCFTGSAQHQVMLAAMAEPDPAPRGRKNAAKQKQADPSVGKTDKGKGAKKAAAAAAAAAAADPEAEAEVQAAGADGLKKRKKRHLVKGKDLKEKDLTGQARRTRARTASQKGDAAVESSDADDQSTDGDAAEM